MSFTVTQRSSVNSGTTDVGSQATASFTPTANSRLFVFAYAHRFNNTNTRSWTISDTLSSTWTKLDETALFAWQTLTEYAIGAVAWYTDIGSSPAARTVTVDASAGSEFYGVIAFDVTGYDTGAPFPQGSVDGGAAVDPSSDTASGTLTLGSAPTNGNLVVAMFCSGAYEGGGGFATPSGYTALTNQNQSYSQAAVFYRTNTTTAAVTCSDLGQVVGNWAGIIFEMTLAGGTTYNQSASGAISPAGALARRTNKSLAGAISPAGTLVKRTAKSLAGAISPAGALAKRTARSLSGAITPSGALSAIKTALVSLSGAISPSGTLSKRTAKSLGGAISPAGALTKLTAKSFGGAITPAGALATVKAYLVSLGGAISPAGALVKRTGKSLGGAISPAGALTKLTAKSFGGAISPGGVLSAVRAVLVSLAGAISPSGTLSRSIRFNVAGAITPAGGLVKRISKVLSGVLSFVGAAVGVSSTPGATIRRVELHLNSRSFELTLADRTTSLTLKEPVD